ncbi:hypothetical protein BT69DRAFT_1346944 [Atractiella rhizophila]|nr:hypothetical protein BT69DRAFT_1346944 [Atractiella rhizophila]
MCILCQREAQEAARVQREKASSKRKGKKPSVGIQHLPPELISLIVQHVVDSQHDFPPFESNPPVGMMDFLGAMVANSLDAGDPMPPNGAAGGGGVGVATGMGPEPGASRNSREEEEESDEEMPPLENVVSVPSSVPNHIGTSASATVNQASSSSATNPDTTVSASAAQHSASTTTTTKPFSLNLNPAWPVSPSQPNASQGTNPFSFVGGMVKREEQKGNPVFAPPTSDQTPSMSKASSSAAPQTIVPSAGPSPTPPTPSQAWSTFPQPRILSTPGRTSHRTNSSLDQVPEELKTKPMEYMSIPELERVIVCVQAETLLAEQEMTKLEKDLVEKIKAAGYWDVKDLKAFLGVKEDMIDVPDGIYIPIAPDSRRGELLVKFDALDKRARKCQMWISAVAERFQEFRSAVSSGRVYPRGDFKKEVTIPGSASMKKNASSGLSWTTGFLNKTAPLKNSTSTPNESASLPSSSGATDKTLKVTPHKLTTPSAETTKPRLQWNTGFLNSTSSDSTKAPTKTQDAINGYSNPYPSTSNGSLDAQSRSQNESDSRSFSVHPIPSFASSVAPDGGNDEELEDEDGLNEEDADADNLETYTEDDEDDEDYDDEMAMYKLRNPPTYPDGVPTSPLLPLCLVNRSFLRAAREKLYRHVTLHDAYQVHLFLQTLKSTPAAVPIYLGSKTEHGLGGFTHHVKGLYFMQPDDIGLARGGGRLILDVIKMCKRLEQLKLCMGFMESAAYEVMSAIASAENLKGLAMRTSSDELTPMVITIPRIYKLMSHLPNLREADFCDIRPSAEGQIWEEDDFWDCNADDEIDDDYLDGEDGEGVGIRSIPGLKVLDLSHPVIEGDELEAILRQSKNLEELRIRHPSRSLTRAALTKAIMCHGLTLTSLNLSLQTEWHPVTVPLTAPAVPYVPSPLPSYPSPEQIKKVSRHPYLGDILIRWLPSLKNLTLDGPIYSNAIWSGLPDSMEKISLRGSKVLTASPVFAKLKKGMDIWVPARKAESKLIKREKKERNRLGRPALPLNSWELVDYLLPPEKRAVITHKSTFQRQNAAYTALPLIHYANNGKGLLALPNLTCLHLGDFMTWKEKDRKAISSLCDKRKICLHGASPPAGVDGLGAAAAFAAMGGIPLPLGMLG